MDLWSFKNCKFATSAIRVVAWVLLCAIYMVPESIYAQAKRPMRKLDFSWEPVAKAKGYELQFVRTAADGATDPLTFSSASSAFKGDIPVGQYKLKIRTLDARGVPGAWSPAMPVELKLPVVEASTPPADKVIQSEEAEEDKVRLAWKPIGEGVLYRVAVLNKKGKKIAEETVDEPEIEMKLNVAREYLWRVTAKLEDGFMGEEWETAREFSLIGAALETPEIKSNYSKEKPIVKWSRPKFTGAYKFDVSIKTGEKEWKELVREDEYRRSAFKVPKDWGPGTYRVNVVALASLRAPSKSLEYDFEITAPEEAVAKHESGKNKGKAKSAGTGARSPHQIEVGYNYVPLLRSISIASEAATASFNVFVGTSNAFGGTYTYTKGWQAMGFGGGLHMTKKDLFDTATEEEAGSQTAQNIDTTDFHLLGHYRLQAWGVGVGPVVGMQKRSMFLLKSEDLESFQVERIPLTEILVGGALGLYLDSGSKTELSFLKASPTGAKKTTSYSRSVISLNIAQPLFSPRFFVTGGYVYDSASFEYYVRSVVDVYASKWTNNMLNFGVAYAF